MSKNVEQDHAVIYLEPEHCADPCTGRTWCEDDGNWIDEDGRYVNGTRYVRSDLHDATIAALREKVEAAYREGYGDGRWDGAAIADGGTADTPDSAWAQSNARRALTT